MCVALALGTSSSVILQWTPSPNTLHASQEDQSTRVPNDVASAAIEPGNSIAVAMHSRNHSEASSTCRPLHMRVNPRTETLQACMSTPWPGHPEGKMGSASCASHRATSPRGQRQTSVSAGSSGRGWCPARIEAPPLRQQRGLYESHSVAEHREWSSHLARTTAGPLP